MDDSCKNVEKDAKENNLYQIVGMLLHCFLNIFFKLSSTRVIQKGLLETSYSGLV